MSELIIWKDQKIRKLRRDMDRLFDRVWSDFGVTAFPGGVSTGLFVDLSETEDSLIVTAEIPGISPEELEIFVAGNRLIIRGEKRQEESLENAYCYRVERRFGSFSRRILLPRPVDGERAKASYKRGVLNIIMPKKGEAGESESRKIEIK